MPEGQWSFLESKGPRKKLTVEISPEAHILLKVAASMYETSPTGQAVDVLERWAESFLERHVDALTADVEREKRARSRSPVQRRASSGRSVQRGE